MCYQGSGPDRAPDEAAKWFEKAADKNNDTAQNMLGVIYENGDGVSQDYSQAESWYRKAALNDNEAGLYNLGDLYERGMRVVKDPDRAARWFRKAALNGFDLAQFKLGTLYYCGEGGGCPGTEKSPAMVFQCRRTGPPACETFSGKHIPGF